MRTATIFFIAFSLALAPAALDAQAERERGDRASFAERGDRASFAERGHMDPAARALALADQLDLTDDQVASLEAIREEYRGAAEPLLEELREAMPERARFARERGQMTPEQRERMRERMAERRAEREKMTPEQRHEMRERMSERRAEMRERMEELRPVMEQLRDNRREARNEVHAVLTDEQRATLRSSQEERREKMRERAREHRGDREGRGHRQHPR